MKHRALVIGGGVNELVAALYLARGGCDVTLLEDGHVESAFAAGWVPRPIARDLDLYYHNLSIDQPQTWAAAPLPDGGRLELFTDMGRTVEAIRRVSPRDAERWPDFCERMHALAGLLESVYLAPPPDPLTETLTGRVQLGRLALKARRLGRKGIEDLLRLSPMPGADLLDDWFENRTLKGVLGAAGVMHLAQGPGAGGTVFNLLHHHVGSPSGVFRAARSNVYSVLCSLRGIAKRGERVARIMVRGGRAAGVVLEKGEDLSAAIIVSGAPPARTLLEWVDAAWLDPQLVRSIQTIRSRGVTAMLQLTLDRDPGFSTLVIAPSLDYLERAYDHAKHGHASSAPYLDARYVRGGDAHRVHVHVQYAPYRLRDAQWDDERRNALARASIERLAEHAPMIKESIVEQSMLTPLDLERAYGYPQGQPHHAEIALDQTLWMRPTPELAQYRTPIGGLYLCGAAMHPGGGIAGACGANAARVILSDMRRGSRTAS